MSTAPTVLMGPAPLLRAIVRSSTTAANVTITPDDSGTLFVNLATNASITYTLPTVAASAGKVYWFMNAGSTSYSVIISSTTTNFVGGDSAASTTMTSDAVIGSNAMVVSDGTNYYLLAVTGTWTAS